MECHENPAKNSFADTKPQFDRQMDGRCLHTRHSFVNNKNT